MNTLFPSRNVKARVDQSVLSGGSAARNVPFPFTQMHAAPRLADLGITIFIEINLVTTYYNISMDL